MLEILPPAPPLPPRQQTEAELAKEAEKDVQAREMMIISFTGLVQDFMRKFRKVTATVRVRPLLLFSFSFYPSSQAVLFLADPHYSLMLPKGELIGRKRPWS